MLSTARFFGFKDRVSTACLADFYLTRFGYVLRSWEHFPNEENINFLKDHKWHLEKFIAENNAQFLEDIRMLLPKIWHKIVEQNRQYFLR